MAKIDLFIKKIPDDRLLVCGEKGEYWTDIARFSSNKPLLMPPAYDIEGLSGAVEKIEGGYYKGIFFAWGISRLIRERSVLTRLLNCLEDGGDFFAVEVIESEAPPGGKCHLRYLKHHYKCDFLPKNRLAHVLKSVGLSQIRFQEFFPKNDFWTEKASAVFKRHIKKKLAVSDNPARRKLLEDIQREGLEHCPFILIHALKRGAKAVGVDSGKSRKADLEARQDARRKLIERGASELSDAELISLVLDCELELSHRILQQYGGKSLLKENDLGELASLLGIDDDRAVNLIALLETGRRFFEPRLNQMPEIHSPQEAFEYLADMKALKREHLRGLYLDVRGKIIWDEVIAIGNASRALVTPREILAPAIEHGATGLIIAHNHLSEIAQPSQEDIELTIQIEGAADLMKICLWDHLIVAGEGYYSFNAAGKIKSKWKTE